MYEVAVAREVFAKANARYGEERTPTGRPSEYDFVGGPLAAAIREFAYFDDLPQAVGPTVRTVIIVDPFFGTVVFVGGLVRPGSVEIADFEGDPDYWSMVDPTTG